MSSVDSVQQDPPEDQTLPTPIKLFQIQSPTSPPMSPSGQDLPSVTADFECHNLSFDSDCNELRNDPPDNPESQDRETGDFTGSGIQESASEILSFHTYLEVATLRVDACNR